MLKKLLFKIDNLLLNDFRLKLLYYLAFQNKATQQFVVNEWLSKNEKDLGTIRRALIELLDSDFIQISDVPSKDINNLGDASKNDQIEFIKEKLQTKINHDYLIKDYKSSKRLVSQVNNIPKIPFIKMHITLKGIQFINETKNGVRSPIVWLISVIVSLLLGVFFKYIFGD